MPVHTNTGIKEDVDLVENMLKETGCVELHHKVQECVAEHQDWRKCQDVLKEFRLCIENYTLKKSKLKKT